MKKILLVSGLLILIGIPVAFYFVKQMKAISPAKTSVFEKGDLKITVNYNSPSKRGRKIFGGLVPFGAVWRTGANEPTTFETNLDLTILGKKLQKGKYSVWTIPNEKTWTVIFNSEVPFWGVNFNGKTAREASNDALALEVPSVTHDKEFEEFTITVEQGAEDLELIFLWDKTLVTVPFSK